MRGCRKVSSYFEWWKGMIKVIGIYINLNQIVTL